MAFKLTPPYKIDNTPIYSVEMEEGVLGIADKNGSILINKNITSKKQKQEVIRHEKVHLKQMANGDLDYDDKAVYWKGKKYLRSSFHEGNQNLPWEKPAYNKNKK